jgi:hypothetical protein
VTARRVAQLEHELGTGLSYESTQATALGSPEPVYSMPAIDPTKNSLFLFIGRKGSGKSVLARELFRNWPGVDRLVIDPTGDADPGADLQPVKLARVPTAGPDGEPAGLPPGPLTREGKRRPGVWWYVANPQSKTYADDLDRAVGLGLFPKNRKTLTWIDEAGEVFPSGRTGPNARTLLQQSRHWFASALICCPRPVTVDPLVLAQADRVYMFDVPAAPDRKRLADTLGYPLGVMNDWLNIVAESPFWFLMFDAREHAMYLCPPIELRKDIAA